MNSEYYGQLLVGQILKLYKAVKSAINKYYILLMQFSLNFNIFRNSSDYFITLFFLISYMSAV